MYTALKRSDHWSVSGDVDAELTVSFDDEDGKEDEGFGSDDNLWKV